MDKATLTKILDYDLLDIHEVAIALQGIPTNNGLEKLDSYELGKQLEATYNELVKVFINEVNKGL